MMSQLFMFMFFIGFIGAGDDIKKAESAEQLYQQALLKNQAGKLIAASVLLTDAIAIDNKQAKYFYQRGLSFFGMEKVEHGIEDFKRAVDLKTTELRVYLKLIGHHMDQQQYMAVLINTDQLMANLPDQAAGAYYDKGRAYEKMGQFKSARLAYQAALTNLSLESTQGDFIRILQTKIKALKNQENQP